MSTFHQELIERGNNSEHEKEISHRVKDGVRQHAIAVIVQTLDSVILQNYTQFKKEIIKDCLTVFA